MATRSSDLYAKRKNRVPAPLSPRPKFGTHSLSSHFRPTEALNELKTEDPAARLAIQRLEDTKAYVNESIETDEQAE